MLLLPQNIDLQLNQPDERKAKTLRPLRAYMSLLNACWNSTHWPHRLPACTFARWRNQQATFGVPVSVTSACMPEWTSMHTAHSDYIIYGVALQSFLRPNLLVGWDVACVVRGLRNYVDMHLHPLASPIRFWDRRTKIAAVISLFVDSEGETEVWFWTIFMTRFVNRSVFLLSKTWIRLHRPM